MGMLQSKAHFGENISAYLKQCSATITC